MPNKTTKKAIKRKVVRKAKKQSEPLVFRNFYASGVLDKYMIPKTTYDNYDKMRIEVPFRMAVIGASGGGKTTTALNIILDLNCFTKIWLICKKPTEPIYSFFINSLRLAEKKIKAKILTVSDDIAETPDPDSLNDKETNLMIFDDLIAESPKAMKNVSNVFIYGRKMNCSCIFISQSYFDIPKLIRKQCNYIVLRKVHSTKDLLRILQEYSLGLDIETLNSMYEKCTKDFNSFLMIDLETNDKKLKFRRNYTPINTVSDDRITLRKMK